MKLIAIALALTLMLAGCNALPEDVSSHSRGRASTPAAATTPGPQTGPATATAPATKRAPAPAATPPAGTAASSVCGGGSLEGCFTYSQMRQYLDAITPMVGQFFSTSYAGVSRPDIVFIPSGRVVREGCGYGDSAAYEYCAIDRTIYIGQDLLWSFYKQAGDAAPAIGLAHEWGHHLQYELGVPLARTAAQSVKFENQADCISGAWARYAGQQGWLEAGDDLQDVQTLLQAIGSREGPGRDHGTSAEREQAFNSSYQNGIAACDAYFPNNPIG